MTGNEKRLVARSSLAIAWLSVSLVACGAPVPLAPAPSLTTVAPPANATPTALALPTATRAAPTDKPSAGGALTLTLWIVDDIAPGTTGPGRVLRNQLDAFAAANPDIHVDVVPKKPSGKGGMIDFLTSTRSVVPARLPDLVALSTADVPGAAGAGLLQPLDSLLPAEMSADLFPFASLAAHYHNQWIALPIAASIEHLVYNKSAVRKAPVTWDDVTKQKGTMLLPLGGDDAFMLQYFAQGATLTDAANEPAIDAVAVAQTLTFFKRARELGLIPDNALSLKSADDAWPGFAAGQASMAQVSSTRYLSERSKVPNALYAPVPTREGKTVTLASGWALAVITADPTRQAAAARFIQWIVPGEHLAPWLRAVHLIPANRASVALAVDPPDYAGFVRDQLEHATSLPPASSFTRQSEALRNAVSTVWKGQSTPEEAARTAAAK